MISLLNNISALEAQNQLNVTQSKLQNTLFQLSSGQRINSGADDAAGLAIANGLQANITALTQSGQNANSGVGQLQVADGALAQVTNLLNRAVTLATESSSGTVSNSQRGALQAEYSQINQEINSIGSSTNYNGTAVFTAAQQSVFLSDGASNSTIQTSTNVLSAASLGLAAGTVNTTTPAVAATASVSFSGQPAVGETLTVGATTYTFEDAAHFVPATAHEVLIDANSAANTVANLAAAINNGPTGVGAGTLYSTGEPANAAVTASTSGTNITFTAITAGANENKGGSAAIALAEGGTASGNITVPGAGFTGGTNAVAGTVNMPNDLNTAIDAQTTLTYINQAISDVASQRGNIGAEINRLQAASNVESVQVQNLTSAEDSIMAANIPQQVTNLSEYSILNQSGISALAQANSAQQSILKLLQ
jgi:flagellin